MDQNYNGMNVENNNKGLLSLILGIISILFSCVIVGIIPGIISIISGIKNKQGDKKAKVGLILGIVGTALSLIGIIIWIIAGAALVARLSDRDDFVGTGDSYDYSSYDYDIEEDYYNDDVIEENDNIGDISSDTEADTEQEDNVVITDIDGYTPDYDIMLIGSDEVGYTYVPSNFLPFQETGGTGFDNSVQYAYGYEIIGLNSMVSEYDAYTFAQALASTAYSNDAVDHDSIILSTENINGIYGYSIMEYYPGDNMYLYIFVFDGEDGLLHYNSVEFINGGDYNDLWETVFYNYYLN